MKSNIIETLEEADVKIEQLYNYSLFFVHQINFNEERSINKIQMKR
jgi:hypothetical protein